MKKESKEKNETHIRLLSIPQKEFHPSLLM